MRKSTTKELVSELEARNKDGRYDELIRNARHGRYHDFKNPPDVACGKIQFIIDTQQFCEELADLREGIKNGDYDESPDEEDVKDMREDLILDNSPDCLFEQLGFKPPTAQERAFVKVQRRFSGN